LGYVPLIRCRLLNTKQGDVEVESLEQKDDEVVNFQDVTHLSSLNDEVIMETT
jgi:hypothetical protein